MINVLNLALPIVGVVHDNMTVTVRRFVSSTISARGVVQPTFDEIQVGGQIQPITASRQGNQHNGDVAKAAISFWVKAEVHTVETQEVADQIVFDGKIWNVTSVTPWVRNNGWTTGTATLDKEIDAPKPGHEDTPEESGGLVW